MLIALAETDHDNKIVNLQDGTIADDLEASMQERINLTQHVNKQINYCILHNFLDALYDMGFYGMKVPQTLLKRAETAIQQS